MNSQECFSALDDLFAHYGMGDDARASWGAVVYKACSKMQPQHFKAVCEDLLMTAGKWKPTNEDFWAKFHELKAQNGWERGASCDSCDGENGRHKAVGGTWLVLADWRSVVPFPEVATDAFADNSTPCPMDGSESAVRWRQSLNVVLASGWIQVPMQAWRLELCAWKAERAARNAATVAEAVTA